MSNPFDSHEKTPSLTFSNTDPTTGVTTPKPIGTRIGGKIVKAPELVQQSQMGSGKKLFWQDKKKTTDAVDAHGVPNQPAMSIVTVVETPEGNRSMWAQKSSKDGSPCKETSKAIAVAGAKTAEIGGELWWELTGLIPNPQGGQPSKQVKAYYTPPNAFGSAVQENLTDNVAVPTVPGTVPTPPAPPAPPVPAPPAPPAPAATTPKTPEGFTLADLVAAGWTAEQAVAAYPVLAVSAPAAPPAAPTNNDRAAAMAALSEEDLEMLKMRRLPDGSVVPVG
jgi:hypothetical protein